MDPQVSKPEIGSTIRLMRQSSTSLSVRNFPATMSTDKEPAADTAALPAFVAHLAIPEDRYDVGQCVEGELTYALTQETECEGLVVALVGVETLRLNSFGSVQKKAISVVQQVTIVPQTTTLLGRGKFTHPINLYLHDGSLPATGDVVANPGWCSRYSYAITYEIRALLYSKDNKEPTIVARKPLAVNKVAEKRPLRASSDSTSRRVRVCGLVPGICKARATLDVDAIDINTGIVPITISIDNDSRHRVKGIRLRLNSVLDVNAPAEGKTKPVKKVITQRLLSKTSNIMVMPKSMKGDISVQLAMSDVYAHIKKTGKKLEKPLLPSSKLKIGTVRYSVEVIVLIGRWCTQTMKIELPIDLLCLNQTSESPMTPPKSEPEIQRSALECSGVAAALPIPDDTQDNGKEDLKSELRVQTVDDQPHVSTKDGVNGNKIGPEEDLDGKMDSIEESSPTDREW